MESWSKIWKKLRIYNNPYGTWMNQFDVDISSSCVTKPIKDPNRNFKLKLSKYTCSKMRSRPILSCTIVEPWHIIKRKYEDKTEHMLNINMLPRKDTAADSDNKYTLKDILTLRFAKVKTMER
jgi:hypothetical protein